MEAELQASSVSPGSNCQRRRLHRTSPSPALEMSMPVVHGLGGSQVERFHLLKHCATPRSESCHPQLVPTHWYPTSVFCWGVRFLGE